MKENLFQTRDTVKGYRKNPNYSTKLIFLLCVGLLLPVMAKSQSLLVDHSYVSFHYENNYFTISAKGVSIPLYIDTTNYRGVIRAFKDLQTDIEHVTGNKPQLLTKPATKLKRIIVAGSIGKSPVIDKLIKQKKIDVSQIEGKWESYLVQIVKKPWRGIDEAMVIAGSDKRGTIYGIYDLSYQIGVSPWYWWDGVPARHSDALYVKPGIYIQGPPSVKYRGIFLNDEHPDLTRWVNYTYGDVPESENPPIPKGVANYNHEFYAHIFETILRLKGNYLWPAMWNNAFNEDDPENPRLADEYGIVMGTSHQEPMLRAQKEWDRRYIKTLGTWNYAKNPDVLENFWRDGIRRNKNYESLITIGLRGANDTEMAPGGPEANMALLEKIVNVQRNMLTEEFKKDITKVPQVWCLYKEVQDFYEAGMRVPDDVTLLWAEDNWGNVRRLPTAEERKRSGAAGVYYHFDYHGGPRSYQWINTNPIPKIWDQMSLAKEYGADKVWIVNVGHFKGYEFPMEYFMKLGWNTDLYTNDNLYEYTKQWASNLFGEKYAEDIADIIDNYTKYNGRRKPELLRPSTYSLVNYQEAENVVSSYNSIARRAENIYNRLPEESRDAFYDLVLFPTKASALVNEIYLAAAKNELYANQGRASANDFAAETKELFSADTSLMGYYNREFAHGKWNHFMDQTHLGYTRWNDPPFNSLRAIKLSEINVPDTAAMGIGVEGSESAWSGLEDTASLPEFDVFNQGKHYFDIFNKGSQPFEFTAEPGQPWIKLSETTGKIEKDKRIWVSIDWTSAPKGKGTGTIRVRGAKNTLNVNISTFFPQEPSRDSTNGFVEANGYVSIESEHYSNKTDAGESRWIPVEDYGRTLSGMRATAPPETPEATPGKDAPCLEYKMYLFSSGNTDVTLTTSPILNFMANRPIRYAIAFDDQAPQVITLVPENYKAQNGNRDWENTVSNNARQSTSKHTIQTPGYHTLKIWMVDPGIVLEKIVADFGGVKPSYLGPPESFKR